MKRLRIVSLSTAFALVVAGSALAAAPSSNPQAAASAATGDSPAAIRQRVNRLINGESRETDALNLLDAKGYPDFTNFRRDGRNFEATVTRDGKSETVWVDPDTKSVKVM